MVKPRKKASAPEAPVEPQVGDKVTIPRVVSVLEVTHVSRDGDEVNLQRIGTNLEWFRVRTDTSSRRMAIPKGRPTRPIPRSR